MIKSAQNLNRFVQILCKAASFCTSAQILTKKIWSQSHGRRINGSRSSECFRRQTQARYLLPTHWFVMNSALLEVLRSISSVEQPWSVRHTKAFKIACTQQNVSDLAGVAFRSRRKKVLQETQNVVRPSQASVEGPLSCIQFNAFFPGFRALNLKHTTESGGFRRMKMGARLRLGQDLQTDTAETQTHSA